MRPRLILQPIIPQHHPLTTTFGNPTRSGNDPFAGSVASIPPRSGTPSFAVGPRPAHRHAGRSGKGDVVLARPHPGTAQRASDSSKTSISGAATITYLTPHVRVEDGVDDLAGLVVGAFGEGDVADRTGSSRRRGDRGSGSGVVALEDFAELASMTMPSRKWWSRWQAKMSWKMASSL